MKGKTTKITRGEGAIPIPSDCMASVPETNWKGEYFNNTSLSGSPVMVRDDGAGSLNFDWGLGSPSSACGIKPDNFSVRWTRRVYFSNAGTYRFTITTDDGVRLYIDGVLKLNKWVIRGPTTDTVDVSLTAENHTLRMEYFEAGGGATAKLSWKLAQSDCIKSVPSGNWKGEYFNNQTLSGSPVMVRDDGAGSLNFDWGLGSPSSACGVNPDNFSVRWTRTVDIPADTYRFTVTTDDGVRLYVDDVLKLDNWVIRAPTTDKVDVQLAEGFHKLRMEYYEAGGGAVAKLDWAPVPPDCIKSVPSGNWKGEYFNNTSLSGSPVMVRDDGAGSLNFDWGLGSPSSACGVNPDNFSVRWTRKVYLGSATYRFTVTTDGGFKLYIDDALKLDKSIIPGLTTDTVDVEVKCPLVTQEGVLEGVHTLKMEYAEAGGGAVARLDWAINTELLTDTGRDMIELYNFYVETPAWWNNHQVNAFTLEDFVGLMILFELSDLASYSEAVELYKEAAARNMWMDITPWIEQHGALCRRPYYCKGTVFRNGAFNWLYRVESAKRRSNTLKAGGQPDDPDLNLQDIDMGTARAIGEAVLRPPDEWKTFSSRAPYIWGNEGSPDWWNTALRDEYNDLPDHTVLGADKLVWYKYGYWDLDQSTNNTAAVMSLDQTILFYRHED